MPTEAPLQRLSGRVTPLADGLNVRRLLPAAERRSVGPFVFFDHFGPVRLAAEVNSDVAGHPHTGLATVTYLLAGRQVHRDSLGTVQAIEPGAVNWMSAGNGIVHSERMHPEDQGRDREAHGLQLWVALPPELEASAPSFQHVAATELPEHALPGGGTARVLVGQAWGWTSPVRIASPTLYLDISLPPGAALDLPRWADEMAVYSPTLPLEVASVPLSAGEMGVWLPPGSDTGPADAPLTIQAGDLGARFVVIGGQALPQPVRMWWNFVASTREGLAAAAQRWAAGGFPPIPGETERVDGPVWRG